MKRGRAKTMTHDYKRNGTIDLFAALNVQTGEVLHQTRKRHSAHEVLAFFKWIDLHTPQPLEVTSEASEMAPALHPDERVVAQPRRGVVLSAHQPAPEAGHVQQRRRARRCDRRVWTSHWNDDPKPFVWHKTAKQIIAKVKRGRAALDHQAK